MLVLAYEFIGGIYMQIAIDKDGKRTFAFDAKKEKIIFAQYVEVMLFLN